MLLKSGQAEAIKQAMAREGQNFAALLQGPEAKEALAAFLERRKPDFSQVLWASADTGNVVSSPGRHSPAENVSRNQAQAVIVQMICG